MTVIFQECATSKGWQEVTVPSSRPDQPPYTVLVPPWDREAVESAVCDCRGYNFRGRCRHQKEAYGLICQWNELDSIPQTEYQRTFGICPECGGKTHVIVDTRKDRNG